MAKKVAIERGYIGGRIIEPGDTIDWPHERVPGWLVDVGGSASVSAETVEAPLTGAKGKGGRKAKAETVEVPEAEPFGDAPTPVRVENEVNAATGGTQPDWVAPQPVAD